MSIELLILSCLPLIAFAFVDWKYGVRAGVAAAVVLSLSFLVYWRIRNGEWDELLGIETALIAVMGGVSIYIKDSKWFKLQPVVMYLISIVFFAYFHFFDEPYPLKMLPHIQTLVSPEQQEFMKTARFHVLMERFSLGMMATLAIQAGLMTWLALKGKTSHWVMMRSFGIYALLLVMVTIVSSF